MARLSLVGSCGRVTRHGKWGPRVYNIKILYIHQTLEIGFPWRSLNPSPGNETHELWSRRGESRSSVVYMYVHSKDWAPRLIAAVLIAPAWEENECVLCMV